MVVTAACVDAVGNVQTVILSMLVFCDCSCQRDPGPCVCCLRVKTITQELSALPLFRAPPMISVFVYMFLAQQNAHVDEAA